MALTFGIKYLLSVIDTFSRKSMVYGIYNKKPENLIIYVKEFCMYNNIPKELSSYNGGEFKNKIFNGFCKDNNISFIHGAPNNPHSMGIVERFNYTIKKYLSKEYIGNGSNNLIFEDCRLKIINYYNNKQHRLIGTSPNKAYKITDDNEIKKIIDIKDKRTYLKKDDVCLLNPKFIKIGKNTLRANHVKKGKYDTKIPVRIISNSSYGYYLIKSAISYNNHDYEIKSGEEYVVDCFLLKKIKY